MFKKATKEQGRLRLALQGPPGSGKTFSALAIAAGLSPGSIALIDTERGSASLYAGVAAEFDVVELESFEAERYLEAIQAAARSGYQTLIIDSLSHAWNGVGGILERVDDASRRSKNSFTAWKDVTPVQNRLIDAILAYPGHVIVTMRTKVEYVIEQDSRGKSAPRKVGLAPVQRDGLEYEFTLVMEMDLDHRGIVTKSRFPEIADKVIERPGTEMGRRLIGWLSGAVPSRQQPPAMPQEAPVHREASPARTEQRPAAVDPTEARVAKALDAFDRDSHRAGLAEARQIAASDAPASDRLARLTELYRSVSAGSHRPTAPAPTSASARERSVEGRKLMERIDKLRRAAHRAGVTDKVEDVLRFWGPPAEMNDADLAALVANLESVLENAK